MDIFKLETAKTLIRHYQEYFPKIIYIKCEPDIFVEIGNSIDENIQISNLLTGNCIQAYSQLTKKKIKNNFEVKKYGYMIKENGNISFMNFNYNKLDIFETLLLDEKYEKYLEQSKNKTRKEEYKNLNETKNNIPLKVQLENIISQDNTNIDALFEYLMNLKENKDQEFKEKLKKYIFLLDINKIKMLDKSFEGELYQNFFDEKTNLIKFLEKVIDEDYTENTSVNLILSEINSTDSIQNEVISPYICFNKENYINSPIPISDCNLFFHYIRVKFFQFLKDVFDGQSELLQFCIQLKEKKI